MTNKEKIIMDREFVFEELKDKLSERMKEIHQANSKVILICHTEDEVRCVKVLQAAGLDATTIKHEDERLLPKGKCVVIINTDDVDIADKTEQIKAALERVLTIHTQMPIPQQRIDEYEEILKQKGALKTYVIQEGDNIVYNEDLGCRVNLSQLDRVAKKEEPVSEDLEKAAASYEEKMWKIGHPEDTYNSSDIIKAVKYGANWQKQQMMKDVLREEKVTLSVNRLKELTASVNLGYGEDGLKMGDKVKVIIIKE